MMPFWSRRPAIPRDLMHGGKLSDFGGPRAAVEYRVWVKTQDGREMYFADPEFVGAYLAWKRAQSDLDYYTDIGLPAAVVWDEGIRQYREVTPDTVIPLTELEHPSPARQRAIEEKKEERKQKEAAKARTEEEKELERIRAELDKKVKVKKPTAEEKPTETRGEQVQGNPRRRRRILYGLNPSTLPRYNGWANYPTWAVFLWVSQDEDIVHLLRMRRRKFTPEEASELVELYFPSGVLDFRDKGGPGLYAVVNWQEVAGALNELIGQENPRRTGAETKRSSPRLSATQAVAAGLLSIAAVVVIANLYQGGAS